MISALDFATITATKAGFGVDKDRVAEGLRKLADDILNGRVMCHEVAVFGAARLDDFTGTRLTFLLHERTE